MRRTVAVLALLLLASCAFSPRRCERRLTPINASTAMPARTRAVQP